VDHSSDSTHVNQAVEQLPAAAVKAADPTGRRGNRERNQEHEPGNSHGDVRSFGNVFPHFGQVKEFVEPDVGGEMRATVKKSEESEHAPETDQIRQAQEFPERRDAQGNQDESQGPVARGVSDELNRICGKAAVQRAQAQGRERRDLSSRACRRRVFRAHAGSDAN
jgi:hypothetical protein